MDADLLGHVVPVEVVPKVGKSDGILKIKNVKGPLSVNVWKWSLKWDNHIELCEEEKCQSGLQNRKTRLEF